MEEYDIDPEFIALTAANARYWQQQTADLEDSDLPRLDRERRNLFRAVTYGLHLPQTTLMTAQLVAQLFKLIEQRGYWQEWLSVVEKAMRVAPTLPLKLALQNQLGFFQRLNRQLETAVAHHKSVIAQANHHGLQLEEALAHFYLSNAYYETHQYHEAKIQAEAALVRFEKLPNPMRLTKLAAVFNILGLIEQSLGQHTSAKALFLRALVYWQQTNELTYQSRTWSNLGLTYIALSEYDAALASFDDALTILSETASELDVAKAELNWGLIFYEQKRWTNAEAAFRRADSEAMRRSGDRYTQAMIANNLGYTLLKQNRLPEVEPYFQKSLQHWQAIEAKVMQANTWGGMAELREQQQRFSEAIVFCDKAIAQLAHYPHHAYAQKRLNELQLLRARCTPQ